jgi:plasmid stabilization system protein ParE
VSDVPPKLLEFHPDAANEVREAYAWYQQRSLRSAAAFLDELRIASEAVQADPERFGAYLHGCRRRQLRRYPYLLVYLEMDDAIRIVSVAHTRRRPGYWRQRLP